MKELTEQELNAWVARNVMGWTLADRKAMGWGDGEPVWMTGDNREEGSPTYQGFEPCGDRVAAMLVLEKCCKFSANACDIRENAGEWRVACSSWHSLESAPTLPLAICRFAYKLFNPHTP